MFQKCRESARKTPAKRPFYSSSKSREVYGQVRWQKLFFLRLLYWKWGCQKRFITLASSLEPLLLFNIQTPSLFKKFNWPFFTSHFLLAVQIFSAKRGRCHFPTDHFWFVWNKRKCRKLPRTNVLKIKFVLYTVQCTVYSVQG